MKKTFWKRFTDSYWEQKSVLIKKAPMDLVQIDADTIFNWLVQYSDHCRKTKTTEGIKFYIHGESQYRNEVLQVLPEKFDLNLLGYHKRMEEIFSDYCLVCDELVQVSGKSFRILNSFLTGLFEQVGYPNRHVEIGLYLGNYKKTPFGVHVDGCGVFSIPVVGTKKFRIWSPGYVAKNPDLELAFDYKKHLKASKLLTAQPGDLAYWPSSAWHIAESDGTFSATWSLGVWVDLDFSEVILKTLKPFIEAKLGKDSKIKTISFKKGEVLPRILKRSIERLGTISNNELHDLFLKQWLKVQSKSGFKSALRPNVKIKLQPNQKIFGSKKHPLHWAKLKSGDLCIALNGELVTTKMTPANQVLIEQINSGEPFKALPKNLKFLNQLFQLEKISTL